MSNIRRKKKQQKYPPDFQIRWKPIPEIKGKFTITPFKKCNQFFNENGEVIWDLEKFSLECAMKLRATGKICSSLFVLEPEYPSP